ncbi:MAG: hypothetical protein R3F20_05080 [Planctomycetota bacterium]
MNFYAHARVADALYRDPEVTLGAMLPDLATMAGRRWDPAAADRPGLARGVALHHATDEAFHGAPAFLSLLERWRERLGAALGLRRGVARAAAHVGIELLLDGIAHEEGEVASYAAALDLAATLETGPLPEIAATASRIGRGPLPAAYADPTFCAARVEGLLGRRPRLALPPGAVGGLGREFRTLRLEISARAAELLDPGVA